MRTLEPILPPTSALTQMILLMVHHPEVLAKAQAQIDEVVGLNRLPSFDDRAKLPYTDYILKEVLRWAPPVPLSMYDDTT